MGFRKVILTPGENGKAGVISQLTDYAISGKLQNCLRTPYEKA
jgi:hypothetical protein